MISKIITRITRTVIVLIILALIGGWIYTTHKLKKELQQTQEAHQGIMAFYSDSISNLYIMATRYGDSLHQARQIILTQESALELGVISKEEMKEKYLKSVQTITRLKEQITVLNRPGEYIETPQVNDSCDCLQLPFSMDFTDPWFYLKVTAGVHLPSLDSLNMYSSPVITAGMQKDPGLKNIFQRPYPVVNYDNPNHYITPVDIQYIRIDPDQKWYQTDGAKMGAAGFFGFLFGVFANK